MAELHVLRVFCDEEWSHGNPLGVFLGGDEVPEERRQEVAAELGFSETVFVDDATEGRMRIFTPGLELGFAGHPTVGTAWLLAKEREAVPVLRPPAGEVEVRTEGGLTFVAARPEWGPDWKFFQLEDALAVEEAPDVPEGTDVGCIWAWIDEAEGTVRSRCFSHDDGVGEDEATGSAAICLAVEVGRDIEIRQGRGSRLDARFLGEGRAEVGGRVVLDEVREF
ncbi:MAG TPA: PhzF family phenazine biosynthesis protein [Solirubrobacterales bacterium]|jgi:predicted PhzF superfamily epimerase YddE/YHI9|nr:PhzF family phenazine biosynthesis protein [Solirubrobacterales bacterium]